MVLRGEHVLSRFTDQLNIETNMHKKQHEINYSTYQVERNKQYEQMTITMKQVANQSTISGTHMRTHASRPHSFGNILIDMFSFHVTMLKCKTRSNNIMSARGIRFKYIVTACRTQTKYIVLTHATQSKYIESARGTRSNNMLIHHYLMSFFILLTLFHQAFFIQDITLIKR